MLKCWTWHLWCGQAVALCKYYQHSVCLKMMKLTFVMLSSSCLYSSVYPLTFVMDTAPTKSWLQSSNHWKDHQPTQTRQSNYKLAPESLYPQYLPRHQPSTSKEDSDTQPNNNPRWDESYPGPKDPWDPDREACQQMRWVLPWTQGPLRSWQSGLDSRRTAKYTSDQPAQNYFSPHEWEWQKPDRNNQYCETVE